MTHRVGPFNQELGDDLKHYAINAPGDTVSAGYPPDLFNLNPNDEKSRNLFISQMIQTREEYGYQGIWADSFQNLFMSTRDWAAGDGLPLQRQWWEIIAEWSRDGVTWTGESHSMPGLSCSIEVDSDPFTNWFYYIDVARWWRVGYPENPETGGDALAFRLAAARGWAAPQIAYGAKITKSVPHFKQLAAQFTAAQPSMRRGYQLGADSGSLWLGYEDNQNGVWFSFQDQPIPEESLRKIF